MTVFKLGRGRALALSLAGTLALVAPLTGGEMQPTELASSLIALKSSVLKADEEAAAKTALFDDNHARMRVDMARQTAAFDKVATPAEWEKFRDERLAAMRTSFGSTGQPLAPAPLPAEAKPSPGGCEITGTTEGDGFRVANLVIAGRPGLPITANLYMPATPSNSMPGILIMTAHHNPKVQSELLDMGATWARSGCLVIIPDNIGYGERRQQPYGGREDYRWRYFMGMQLETVGESLMGWMVADLRRALDVLTVQPGVDPKRIIALGSVAGGGDVVSVLAATDNRVTCVIPYNYGSATAVKPVSDDETTWINFIGWGDMDTVRCLRNSGRDGFNPWMILAASAPRRLIYAKEFPWQPAGDEGYARLARVYNLYGASDHLDHSQGGTDCNNVDAVHRKKFYPILERWFNMPVPVEAKAKRWSQELVCMTPEARTRWRMRPVHEILAELGAKQLANGRAALAALPADKRKEQLRKLWAARLGSIAPAASTQVERTETVDGNGFVAERLLLSAEPTMPLPTLLLKPKFGAAKFPVVLCVAQEGKDTFVSKRAMEIAELLQHGVAVCLVDVRGTGETKPDTHDRYWYSSVVDTAGCELMVGDTTLGLRIRDLRNVLRHLQSRADIDGHRVAVWGDSFAPVNPSKFVDPPMKTDCSALLAEPMGASAAILLALFEDDVQAVIARGGLTGFAALLDGPACHVVLDAIVPQALETGDLSEVVATLEPRPVRLEALIDGRNRLANQERLERDLASARAAYRPHAANLQLSPSPQDDVAEWVAAALNR